MLHDLELEFIKFVQLLRSPLSDSFFKSLDFFDRREFFFILIPIVWLGHGWKNGFRLFYILLFSSLVNHSLKVFFLLPRPYMLDPDVGIIQVGGYGFPSGAAQTVILLSGILLTSWKNPWKWAIASAYILLVSFSRIYLGVHFPSDILGGWLVGLCLLAIYLRVFPPVETRLEKLNPPILLLLSQLFPMLLLTWQNTASAIGLCSVAMGMGMGLFACRFYRFILLPPKSKKEYALRAITGVLGTFICYALAASISISNPGFDLFLRFFTVGLWISLGSTLVCRKLFPGSQYAF